MPTYRFLRIGDAAPHVVVAGHYELSDGYMIFAGVTLIDGRPKPPTPPYYLTARVQGDVEIIVDGL